MSKLLAALMSSPILHGHGKPHSSLSTLPPEVATNIFIQLPSLPDVIALSSTSHRLQDLWSQNVNLIYSNVAPKSITCEAAARRFLVDQGGPNLTHSMSAKDVVRLLQNAAVVDGAILQFEREIVSRVRSECTLSYIIEGAGLRFDDRSGRSITRRLLRLRCTQASSNPDLN